MFLSLQQIYHDTLSNANSQDIVLARKFGKANLVFNICQCQNIEIKAKNKYGKNRTVHKQESKLDNVSFQVQETKKEKDRKRKIKGYS